KVNATLTNKLNGCIQVSQNLFAVQLDMLNLIPWPVWLIVGLAFLVAGVWQPARHGWRIRKAERQLDRLRQIGDQSGAVGQLGFLRSAAVDPFTFEEMILT